MGGKGNPEWFTPEKAGKDKGARGGRVKHIRKIAINDAVVARK